MGNRKITNHIKLLASQSDNSKNPIIPATSFSGLQLVNLYNVPTVVPSNKNTRVVKIAIIIAYSCPTLLKDLYMYWKSLHGPESTPPKINVYTMPGATYDSSWGLEECLDVQMVATINPNADIWVVEAKSSSIHDLTIAILYAKDSLNADILSMSFGGIDTSAFNSSNYVFTNPSNPANYKCFLASSGDNNYVCWPSVSHNVLSIGGTTLNTTQSDTTKRQEYTWQKAGCGYSKTVAKPSYQNKVNLGSKQRAIPDISLIANPETGVNIVYNGNWFILGGTSVGCPIASSILSLAIQKRFNIGKPPLTTVYTQTPNSTIPPSIIPKTHVQNFLYNNILHNKQLYSNCFTDIIQGTDGRYTASKGYDIATGVGSPNATSLCNILSTNIA